MPVPDNRFRLRESVPRPPYEIRHDKPHVLPEEEPVEPRVSMILLPLCLAIIRRLASPDSNGSIILAIRLRNMSSKRSIAPNHFAKPKYGLLSPVLQGQLFPLRFPVLC